MATVDDLIDLVERGWAPNHICQTLQVKPYRLGQMLATRRLAKLLEIHKQLAEVVARHKACISSPQAVSVLQHIVEACREPRESSRKAASQLLRLAGITGRWRKADQPQAVGWDESAEGRCPTRARASASKDEVWTERWETALRAVSPTLHADGTAGGANPPTLNSALRPPNSALRTPNSALSGPHSGDEIFRDFPPLSAGGEGKNSRNSMQERELPTNDGQTISAGGEAAASWHGKDEGPTVGGMGEGRAAVGEKY